MCATGDQIRPARPLKTGYKPRLAGALAQCHRLTVDPGLANISSMNDKTGQPVAISPQEMLGPTSAADEELASLAKALAHPARVQILRILARSTSCICGDIVSQMSLAQSTVSEHLRVLKTAGLIIGRIDGPRVCYCINAHALYRFKFLVSELPSPIDVSGILAACIVSGETDGGA